ncbi:heme-binding protein [Sphingobium naphthae]|nr:heme-binding protein [Sphingobium naphthae]
MTSVIVPRNSINREAAQGLIDRALARAIEHGRNVSIAVVDNGGSLVAFTRMDEAKISTIQVAMDKAFTCATTRKSTHDWGEYIKNDPPLAAYLPGTVNRLIVYGGGVPIIYNGECIGGLGVSGSHYTGDMDISEFALEGFGTPA